MWNNAKSSRSQMSCQKPLWEWAVAEIFGWDCFLLMIEKLRACYFIEPLDISGFTVQTVKLFKDERITEE